MICPYFAESVGGGDVSTKVFIDELNKRHSDVDVFVLSNKINKDKIGGKYSKYNLVKLKFFNFLSTGWRAFLLNTNLFDYYLSLKLMKVIKKLKINVIHVQEILYLPAAVKVGKKLGIPVINTIRDDRFVCNLATCREDAQLFYHCSNKQYMKCLRKTSKDTFGFGFLSYFLYGFLRPRSKILLNSLKKCDKLVSVSDYVKGNLVKMGVLGESIMTAYNLIPEWKVDDVEIKELRKKFNSDNKNQFDGKKFVIFSSGRIVKNKGFQVLIKSLSSVGKDVLVVIAGDGGYLGELKKLVLDLGLQDQVKFTGKLSHDEIKNYYAVSDVVIVPSLIKESLSRVIYDSIGVGKPVIVADVGGNKELFYTKFSNKYKLVFRHVSDGGKGLDLGWMLNELKKNKRFYNNYWKKFKNFNKENTGAYVKLYYKLRN